MVFHFFQSSAVITKLTAVEIDSCLKTATEEKEDQTDLNVSTGSLPALSQVDQDEESLHEPFANSTVATSEIKGSTAVSKSPSILKRKRSSIDPNEANGATEPAGFTDDTKGADTDGSALVTKGRVSESFDHADRDRWGPFLFFQSNMYGYRPLLANFWKISGTV